MAFSDYLEKYGPSVKELAEMTARCRRTKAANALESYIFDQKGTRETRRGAFLSAWDLCQEVMVFMHMAQDARAAAEKDSGAQPT